MDNNLPLVYSTEIDGRWGDMDAFGHVNNATYLTYCEQARVMLLRDKKLHNHGDSIGPVMVTADLTFIKPLVTPAKIEIKLYAGDIGRSSFMTFHEIYSEGVLYCTCWVKLVWVDYQLGKSIPLPEPIANFLRSC